MDQKKSTTMPVVIGLVALIIGVVIGYIMANGSDQSKLSDKDTQITALQAQVKVMKRSQTSQQGVLVGGALMTPDRDIVQNALNASNVTTLVKAVQAAGLVDTLKGKGPFTVFAPTNDAFAKLPVGTVDTLLKPENKSKLVDILTYHVIAGSYKIADLTDGQILTTVEGKTLKVTKNGSSIMINGATIQTPDVISSNGVTHVIDTVLMPQ